MDIETFINLARATRADSVTACREFPAEQFDTELIPGFMTFHRLNEHILETGWVLTGALLDGHDHFNKPEFRAKLAAYMPAVDAAASPEELANALHERLEERLAQFRAAAPGFWDREVTHFSGARVSMMEMLLLIRHHEGEHRAQAALLSRMCGIVPSSTRKRLAAQKAAAR